jgi:hypothetical protein
MGEKNRHFSREFKRDAVQLVIEIGGSLGSSVSIGKLKSTNRLRFIYYPFLFMVDIGTVFAQL